MIKIFLWILAIIIGFYIFLGAALYFFQEKFLFHPSHKNFSPPKDLSLEEIYFKTSDGITLHGRYLDMKSKYTILFFHGNGGNISLSNERIRFFKRLGLNAFIFDYRGYGFSKGEIVKEQNFYEDGLAAYKFLKNKKNISDEKIIFWGQSLGNAASLEIAQHKKIKAIIFESGFSSLTKMAQEKYGIYPQSLLLKYFFENDKKISQIYSPVLVVHSEEDTQISISHGEKIFELANKPKKFLKISGGHGGGWYQSQNIYFEGIEKFLKNL